MKWAGGKRWLLPEIEPVWQRYKDRRLVEPFCGGLAVVTGLMPEKALLNATSSRAMVRNVSSPSAFTALSFVSSASPRKARTSRRARSPRAWSSQVRSTLRSPALPRSRGSGSGGSSAPASRRTSGLGDVLAPPCGQFALEQLLQELHSEVALWHAVHLGQELVGEDRDIGLLESAAAKMSTTPSVATAREVICRTAWSISSSGCASPGARLASTAVPGRDNKSADAPGAAWDEYRCAPRNGRCRMHGGLSTGPKTEEGRERVAQALRERWAKWRAAR